jgi:hypothetical protein
MASEAVTQPTMTTVLENVERDLSTNDSNITKYAPPKHRVSMPGNGEFERIQSNLRKTGAEFLEHMHQLQIWLDSTKTTVETLVRSIG